MPKKVKTTEEHLKTIEFLLAGVLLKKETDMRKVAKIIGCSDSMLTELYPEKKKSSKKSKTEVTTDG